MNKVGNFDRLFLILFERQIVAMRTVQQMTTEKQIMLLGLIYSGFGATMLMFNKVQIAATGAHRNEMIGLLNVLGSIWEAFMPLLIILGVCYIAFGFALKRYAFVNLTLFVVLAIASIAWALLYAIATFEFVKAMSNMFPIGLFKAYAYIAGCVGCLFVIMLFVAPQLYLYKELKLHQKNKA